MYYIGDVGLNHNGSLSRALKTISIAKSIGFDCVKFQVYDADNLYRGTAPAILKKGEFDLAWLETISNYCHDLRIDLAITPFYPQAVEIIAPYVDWIKLGSYEIAYTDLLDAIGESGKEVIISTGMASNEDIENAVNIIGKCNIMALLECISEYPCTPEQCDMKNMEYLQGFGFPVGWSDHSRNEGVIAAAYMAGAEYIEMHLSLDSEGLEFDGGHVWLPPFAREAIDIVNTMEKCFEYSNYAPNISLRTDPCDGKRPIKK